MHGDGAEPGRDKAIAGRAGGSRAIAGGVDGEGRSRTEAAGDRLKGPEPVGAERRAYAGAGVGCPATAAADFAAQGAAASRPVARDRSMGPGPVGAESWASAEAGVEALAPAPAAAVGSEAADSLTRGEPASRPAVGEVDKACSS